MSSRLNFNEWQVLKKLHRREPRRAGRVKSIFRGENKVMKINFETFCARDAVMNGKWKFCHHTSNETSSHRDIDPNILTDRS